MTDIRMGYQENYEFCDFVKNFYLHIIWPLRISKDSMVSKSLIIMFQEAIESGKKLFMYLNDLHLNSRKRLLAQP